MARFRGSRNAGFDAQRSVLAARMRARLAHRAAPHLAFFHQPGTTLAEPSAAVSAYIALGLRQTVAAGRHTLGHSEGLGRPTVGATYFIESLKPLIAAVEARLSAHKARGDARNQVRKAALRQVSPVMLARLQQLALGECETRPLDLGAFVQTCSEAFVRASALTSPEDHTR